MSQPTQNTPDQSSTGRHIPALDGVRGLAVLGVLLTHLFVRNPAPHAALPIRVVTLLLASGWVGVDLFFVLSGFLITGILYDTRQSPHFFRNFYARRALRIFPLYYGVLLTLIAVSSAQGYHWIPRGTTLYLTYLHTLLLGNIGYTTAPWVNINHLWSLAIEEQFYLVWPITVFLLATRRRIFLGALLGAAASFAIRCWAQFSGLIHTYPYAVYSWTPARLDGILLGAALAMLLRSPRAVTVLRAAHAALLTGGLITLTLLFTLGDHFAPLANPFMATGGGLLLALTFCAFVAAVLRPGTRLSAFCANPLLRLFGRLSYGLYVFHFILHQFLEAPLYRLLGAHTASRPLIVLGSGTVILLASLAVAALSFHFFEQPLLRLKRYFPDTGHRPKLREDIETATRKTT